MHVIGKHFLNCEALSRAYNGEVLERRIVATVTRTESLQHTTEVMIWRFELFIYFGHAKNGHLVDLFIIDEFITHCY